MYFKLKVCIASDLICNLKSSPIDKPCCWPVVVAVATVANPTTFLNEPVTLFWIVSILLSSPPTMSIDPKKRRLSINPGVFTVDSPIYSLFNLTQ